MNRKIIDYDVLVAKSVSDLAEGVCNYMKNKWQPLGGMATSTTSTYDLKFYQAMVKYEETKTENK